jgi:hypothetical protein
MWPQIRPDERLSIEPEHVSIELVDVRIEPKPPRRRSFLATFSKSGEGYLHDQQE